MLVDMELMQFTYNKFITVQLSYNYGRAQRGDRTAEDGGRQNEVLLRTLKRTRLAKRVHIGKNLDNFETQKTESPKLSLL